MTHPSPPQAAIFLVRQQLYGRTNWVLFPAMLAGIAALMPYFDVLAPMLGSLPIWLAVGLGMTVGFIGLMLVFLLGAIPVGMLANALIKTLWREPRGPQKLTLSAAGVHTARTGLVPWARVSKLRQGNSDDMDLGWWGLHCAGQSDWRLYLHPDAPGTCEDLQRFIDAHEAHAAAQTHPDGLPCDLWAQQVSPRLWAAYLRYAPWGLFSLCVALVCVTNDSAFGAVYWLAFCWFFVWCCWQLFGDQWYMWLTGCDKALPFFIDRGGVLLNHRRKPLAHLAQCDWYFGPWPRGRSASDRPVLSLYQGARCVLQLSPGWYRPSEALPIQWQALLAALAHRIKARPEGPTT